MADTYTLISSVTVGAGGASSIDFTSIPATYTDLLVKLSSRNTSTGGAIYLRFNGSTSSYTVRYLEGNGAAASSGTDSTYLYVSELNTSSTTASTFSSADIYIPNYAGSTNKSVSADSVSENNATTAYAGIYAGLWSNTSAITQVTLYPSANTFAQYSTAYLYGIKNS